MKNANKMRKKWSNREKKGDDEELQKATDGRGEKDEEQEEEDEEQHKYQKKPKRIQEEGKLERETTVGRMKKKKRSRIALTIE